MGAAALPPGGRAWDQQFDLVAADGVRLRAALWRGQGPRGLVYLLTGRTEFLEKACIVAAELVARGFSVVSVDWRGQGGSARLLDEPLKGHVGDFEDYHLDLEAVVAIPELTELKGPRLMLAHSMGSTIGLGAMFRDRFVVDACILSAPMMGVNLKPTMRVSADATIWFARRLGRMDRWPPMRDMDVPYIFQGFDNNMLTGDREVFDWVNATLRAMPEMQVAMPTIGWLDAATRETEWLRSKGPIPVPSICVVGAEERVIDLALLTRETRRMGAEIVKIPRGRHEVLVDVPEVRQQAWAAIDRFLDARGF